MENPVANAQSESPVHRQSILGTFLRGRPRGTSQSQTNSGDRDDHSPVHPHSHNTISPGPGHRRRPAGTALQATLPPITPTNGLSQMLRRRRSANGISTSTAPVQPLSAPPRPSTGSGAVAAVTAALSSSPVSPVPPAIPPSNPNGPPHRIRLVPHLDSHRSLHFIPISRDVREGDTALRIGRFTDRSGHNVATANATGSNKLAFKSKVVSRAHAEIWCESGGKFFIKDTKSSSGTFLNHIRLSPPNNESKPFPIKDGDVLQLGVDYQGGTEDIYKCVKMRIEMGREWQAGANAFNTNALQQLKSLSVSPGKTAPPAPQSHIADCCICLFQVSIHQSLFIAPCSHVFHYKCIRPLLTLHHPGFSCPLCRTFANLEDDVELEADDVGAALAAEHAAEALAITLSTATGNRFPSATAGATVVPSGAGGAETDIETDAATRPTQRSRWGSRSGTGPDVVDLTEEDDVEPDGDDLDAVMVDLDADADADAEGSAEAHRLPSPSPSPPLPSLPEEALDSLLALHASTSARMDAEADAEDSEGSGSAGGSGAGHEPVPPGGWTTSGEGDARDPNGTVGAKRKR